MYKNSTKGRREVNGSILLKGSHIMCDVLRYKFRIDYNTLKMYIINHRVTTKERSIARKLTGKF